MSRWILLRGLTRESRHWGGFPARLLQAGIGPVTRLDLAGNGVLYRQASPASVREMLVAARQRLAALGLKPPYSLLAMSLGGMVAVDWAQQHPADVERLVLVNTSMRPFSPATQRLRPASWPGLLQIAAGWTHGAGVERRIHELSCADSSALERDAAQWLQIRRSAPVSRANALRQLWAAARFKAEAQAPVCPLLLLSSAADRLVSPECSARLADAWGARHVRHAWAGHDLPHDDPGWTSQTIADWLRQQSPAAGSVTTF